VISKYFVEIFSSQKVEPETDSKILNTIITNANDLKRNKTSINVFLLCLEGESSEDFSFWHNFDENAALVYDVNGFCEAIKRKTYALRANTSVPFCLAEGVAFAVGVYYLIKPKTAPKYIYLNPETNQRVECKTHYIRPQKGDDENGEAHEIDDEEGNGEPEVLFSQDMKYALELGGEQVLISQQEKQALNRIDRPGITLIGFKPLSLLKQSYRMGPSTYMYPLESAIKGSVELYHALLIKCLEHKLFMLARYTQKMNTSPKLVAIVPQPSSHPNNPNLDLHMFEGFHIVPLPFAEDSRSLEEKFYLPQGHTRPSATQEQIKAAGDFIKRLTVNDFQPDSFANPINQRIYKAVETLALDLEEFDENSEDLDQLCPYFKNPKYADRAKVELDNFMNSCQKVDL